MPRTIQPVQSEPSVPPGPSVPDAPQRLEGYPRYRAWLLVCFLSIAAYGNSLGNSFAYDDVPIIAENERVHRGDFSEIVTSPYWSEPLENTGLYRPVTMASYALEWEVWDGDPVGFHAANILFHTVVSLLVLVLVARFIPLLWATVGAGVFAIHPLHTEVVANVVGRAELYAALFFLVGCLIYDAGRKWGPRGRALRVIAVPGCYLLALGGKEIAVTMPGLLVLLDAVRSSGWKEAARRVRDEFPLYLLLAITLMGYLGLRYLSVGGILGENAAGPLRGLDTGSRILTSISLWGEYLRLLIFPLDLAADYGPGVFLPSVSMNVQVVLGLLVLLVFSFAVVLSWDLERAVAFGILWFGLTVLPVSHLFFPTGTVLAERTLYLPSVGLAFALGGVFRRISLEVTTRTAQRFVVAAGLLAGFALFIRTVERNPTWFNTHTVMTALAEDHAESYRSLQFVADGMARVGAMGEAQQYYDAALEMAPFSNRVAMQAGRFSRRRRELDRAERLFRSVVESIPTSQAAKYELANTLILQGRAREALSVALGGLRGNRRDERLWDAVSEAHISLGNLPAALRARRVAVGLDPSRERNWTRLADLLERFGDNDGAARARSNAERLSSDGGP